MSTSRRLSHLPVYIRIGLPPASRTARGEPLPLGSELVKPKADTPPSERQRPAVGPFEFRRPERADTFRATLAKHMARAMTGVD